MDAIWSSGLHPGTPLVSNSDQIRSPVIGSAAAEPWRPFLVAFCDLTLPSPELPRISAVGIGIGIGIGPDPAPRPAHQSASRSGLPIHRPSPALQRSPPHESSRAAS